MKNEDLGKRVRYFLRQLRHLRFVKESHPGYAKFNYSKYKKDGNNGSQRSISIQRTPVKQTERRDLEIVIDSENDKDSPSKFDESPCWDDSGSPFAFKADKNKLVEIIEENLDDDFSHIESIDGGASVKSFVFSNRNPNFDQALQVKLREEYGFSEDYLKILEKEVGEQKLKDSTYKALRQILEKASSKRTRTEVSDLVYLIKDTQFIKARKSTFSLENLPKVARSLKFKHVPEFQMVSRDGLALSSVFVILKGVISIQKRSSYIDNWEEQLAELGDLTKWKKNVYDKKVEFNAEVKSKIKAEREARLSLKIRRDSSSERSQGSSPQGIFMRSASLKGRNQAYRRTATLSRSRPRRKTSNAKNLKGLQPRSSSNVIRQFVQRQTSRDRNSSISSQNSDKMNRFGPGSTLKEITAADKEKLARLQALQNYKWFQEVATLSSGETFGGFDSSVDEVYKAERIITVSDCHFAELRQLDFTRILRKIEQEKLERKTNFFKELPCFRQIGMMLLRRLAGLFREEKMMRNQLIYEQGKPAAKVFIVFSGTVEILRKKINRLSKKEQAHKQVRYINNHLKDALSPGSQPQRTIEDADTKPLIFKNKVNMMNLKLPPTNIRLATVGEGFILGHEDVINSRNYSTTVRCSSDSAVLFWISSSEFVEKMSRNERIWKQLKEDGQEKDEVKKMKIIQSHNDRRDYAQFYQKIKIREDWSTKHNINIEKEGLGDWRATFDFIVKDQALLAQPEEDTQQEDHHIDKKQKQRATKTLQEAEEYNKETAQLLKGEYNEIGLKQLQKANNRIATFIDNFDLDNLPSKKKPRPNYRKREAKPVGGVRAVMKEIQEKKKAAEIASLKQIELQKFQSIRVNKKEECSPSNRINTHQITSREFPRQDSFRDNHSLQQTGSKRDLLGTCPTMRGSQADPPLQRKNTHFQGSKAPMFDVQHKNTGKRGSQFGTGIQTHFQSHENLSSDGDSSSWLHSHQADMPKVEIVPDSQPSPKKVTEKKKAKTMTIMAERKPQVYSPSMANRGMTMKDFLNRGLSNTSPKSIQVATTFRTANNKTVVPRAFALSPRPVQPEAILSPQRRETVVSDLSAALSSKLSSQSPRFKVASLIGHRQRTRDRNSRVAQSLNGNQFMSLQPTSALGPPVRGFPIQLTMKNLEQSFDRQVTSVKSLDTKEKIAKFYSKRSEVQPTTFSDATSMVQTMASRPVLARRFLEKKVTLQK